MQVMAEFREGDREDEDDDDTERDGLRDLAGWRANVDVLPVRRCLAKPLSIATVSNQFITPGSSSIDGMRA